MTSRTETAHTEPDPSRFSLGALRARASHHPMGLFAIAAVVTAVSISMPSARTILVVQAQMAEADLPAAAFDEPRPASEVETACTGQAWGTESLKCLVAIAKDGGKESSARIRTISGV